MNSSWRTSKSRINRNEKVECFCWSTKQYMRNAQCHSEASEMLNSILANYLLQKPPPRLTSEPPGWKKTWASQIAKNLWRTFSAWQKLQANFMQIAAGLALSNRAKSYNIINFRAHQIKYMLMLSKLCNALVWISKRVQTTTRIYARTVFACIQMNTRK